MRKPRKSDIVSWCANPFVLALIIGLSATLIPFRYGMEVDEGIWNYIARMWMLYDMAPYKDLVENKPPNIFYIFAMSNYLFGLNVWFPKLAAVVSTVATSLVLYVLGKTLHSKSSGLFAMIFFGMGMASYLVGAYTTATETFMVLFTSLSVLYMVKSQREKSVPGYIVYMVLSGFWVGVAISFKQIALADLGAVFFLYVLYRKARTTPHGSFIRDCLLIAAGALTAAAVCVAPVLANGVPVRYYLECVWELILFSGTVHPQAVTVKKSFEVWSQAEMMFYYIGVFWFAVKRKIFAAKAIPVFGLLAWVTVDFLAVNAAGTYWWHHLVQLMPSVSLVAGLAYGVALDSIDLRAQVYRKAVCGSVLFIILMFVPYPAIMDYLKHQALFYDNNPATKNKRELGLWIKEHTVPDDTIYVYESTGSVILAYTDRRSASRHFSRMFLHNPEFTQQFRDELADNPPDYLIVRAGSFFSGLFKQFIIDNYQISTREYGYNIFVPKR